MQREFQLCNKLGLHARAATRFVQVASRYEADISAGCKGRQVNAKSIMGLLMLAAPCGATLLVMADGADAELALEAIGELIADRFGEEA